MAFLNIFNELDTTKLTNLCTNLRSITDGPYDVYFCLYCDSLQPLSRCSICFTEEFCIPFNETIRKLRLAGEQGEEIIAYWNQFCFS